MVKEENVYEKGHNILNIANSIITVNIADDSLDSNAEYPAFIYNQGRAMLPFEDKIFYLERGEFNLVKAK